MKRTLILIAACLTVMILSGGISQAVGQACCGECPPQNCSYGAAMSCIQAGDIWEGSPYCQCHTSCGSWVVQYCLNQGRDTDPTTCQCTGSCNASFAYSCLASGGLIDYVTCQCYYANPCVNPVAYMIYGAYGLNCVSCNYACGISTGDPFIVHYYSQDGATYCWTAADYELNSGEDVCFETSGCFQLCGLFGC